MRPADLPNAPLTRAEVERLWARDRASLVRCGLNLKSLVAFYEDLALRLDAAKQR